MELKVGLAAQASVTQMILQAPDVGLLHSSCEQDALDASLLRHYKAPMMLGTHAG